MRPARALALVAATVAILSAASSASGASPQPTASPKPLVWQKWNHLVGVFDLGLQPDGLGLVAQGAQSFFTLDRAGASTQLTVGGDSYVNSAPGFEAYFAVSAGEPVGGTCRFQHGAIFVIDPKNQKQVLAVDIKTGAPSPFATLPGVDTSLNGIGFDDSGAFGDSPLLVTGARGAQSEVDAIDCHGTAKVITDSAPRLEGGIAVAATSFGAHAGELIATDEVGGDVIAIKPDGTSSVLATYKQLIGGDLGVESVGFVPPGFLKNGGAVYVADRGTAGNPHPGTDNILRLTSNQLTSAGVHEGDLLVATEGGGTTLDVTCAATCSLRVIATGPPPAHIEGHIIFLADQPSQRPVVKPLSSAEPRPSPSSTPAPASSGNSIGTGMTIIGVLLLLSGMALTIRRTTRR